MGRILWAFGTHEDDYMKKEHFGRLEQTRMIIWGRIFWATGTHDDNHMKEHFGRLEHTRTIIWGRIFSATETHEDDMKKEHFGRLEHTRTIIRGRIFWATGSHEDYHTGTEYFGRFEHTMNIIWRKNILGEWNTRGLSYGEITFWAFGTHENDMGKEHSGRFGTHEEDHMRKGHFGRMEHTMTIIWGRKILGDWNTQGL